MCSLTFVLLHSESNTIFLDLHIQHRGAQESTVERHLHSILGDKPCKHVDGTLLQQTRLNRRKNLSQPQIQCHHSKKHT